MQVLDFADGLAPPPPPLDDEDDALPPPPPAALDDADDGADGARPSAKQPKHAAPVESEAPSESSTVIVFGCKDFGIPGSQPHCPDHLRLDEVARRYKHACVLGCSEFAAIPPCCRSHIDSHFKRSLIDALARAPSVLLLDYFWLQCNYYVSNYGMDWLDRKCHAAFALGSSVNVMILPVDVGGNMRAMLTTHEPLPVGVRIELISSGDAEEHHPLVRATLGINSELTHLSQNHATCRGRFHEIQVRYLDRLHPFVVIHRVSCDWRAYLASMLACR